MSEVMVQRKLNSIADLEAIRKRLSEELLPDAATVVVCGGTGCIAFGCKMVAEALESEIKAQGLADKVKLKLTGCHGFCELGPLVVVHPERVFYQGVKPEDAHDIVAKTLVNGETIKRLLYANPATKEKTRTEMEIPFYSGQQRLILGMNGILDPTDIEEYMALGGYSALARALGEMTPDEVLDAVKTSGLRGRGGGGFPTARKWASCRKAILENIHEKTYLDGVACYVVCNADEGDPGAYMNRSELEGNPHSVLEGMIIGAYAIAGGLPAPDLDPNGYIYVRTEYPLALSHFSKALESAREYGLLGEDILGTGFSYDVTVNRGGGAFVCGESTALMASIEGRVGEPRAKHVHTVERGLHDLPTTLNNVETWANVPLIINRGAEWFASIGTEGSKGTKVFSLVGKVKNSGLVEVPMGITLREIIYEIGGGIPKDRKFKAVQTGGPSGGCIPEEYLDTPVDFDELLKLGSMMGSGGMIVMDEATCMVDIARYFTNFLHEESCGKCTPCREGTRQMLRILIRITKGDGREGDVEMLEELGQTIQAASLCGLGQTAANPVLSTIRYFRDEYEAHISERRCPAGVCRPLTTFTIDEEACIGCGACVRTCPADAVAGTKKEPHNIDQDKCTRCGSCREVCPVEAVKVA